MGGADPATAPACAGSADRVGALDGEPAIHSPPGEGTTLRVALPTRAAPEPAPPGEAHVMDDRSAAIVRLRRRRRLALHWGVWSLVQLVLVIIWRPRAPGPSGPGGSCSGGARCRRSIWRAP